VAVPPPVNAVVTMMRLAPVASMDEAAPPPDGPDFEVLATRVIAA